MAARPSWTGAVEFAGFPIHLRAYPRLKSRTSDSFKSLCPCHHQPIKQHKVCATSGDVVANEDLLKSVEVSKGNYAVLSPEALDFIGSAERTDVLKVERFCELDGVPLPLSLSRYALAPNDKIPGSEGPAGILWNGLLATGRAAVIEEFAPRAGSRDQLAVIYADRYGLNMVALPYADEVLDATREWAPEVNAQAGQMFEAFIEQAGYTLDEFSHPAYESSYTARRAEAIEKALKGEIVSAPADAAAPAQAAPDLMAAMQAALASAPKPKKAAKKPKAAA